MCRHQSLFQRFSISFLYQTKLCEGGSIFLSYPGGGGWGFRRLDDHHNFKTDGPYIYKGTMIEVLLPILDHQTQTNVYHGNKGVKCKTKEPIQIIITKQQDQTSTQRKLSVSWTIVCLPRSFMKHETAGLKITTLPLDW